MMMPGLDDEDISQTKFAGLTTFANLPYVHCLAADDDEEEGEEEDGKKKKKRKKSVGVEKFDIAILGAPFDTVSIFLSLFSFISQANFLILIFSFTGCNSSTGSSIWTFGNPPRVKENCSRLLMVGVHGTESFQARVENCGLWGCSAYGFG